MRILNNNATSLCFAYWIRLFARYFENVLVFRANFYCITARYAKVRSVFQINFHLNLFQRKNVAVVH